MAASEGRASVKFNVRVYQPTRFHQQVGSRFRVAVPRRRFKVVVARVVAGS